MQKLIGKRTAQQKIHSVLLGAHALCGLGNNSTERLVSKVDKS